MANSRINIPLFTGVAASVRTQTVVIAGATVHQHYMILADDAGVANPIFSGAQVGAQVAVVADGDKYCRGVQTSGSAKAGIEPVLIAGADATNVVNVLTDASGHPLVGINKVMGEDCQVAGGTEAKSIRVTIANDSTGLLSVDDNGASLTVDAAGTVAADAAVPANPLVTGGRAALTNPTAVGTTGDAVHTMHDDLGRVATVPHHVRDLVADTLVNLQSTTSVTDLLAADANNMNDIVSITLMNSAGTPTQVILFDDDGTTKRWAGSFLCP
jgi:hypothetical protein